MTKGRFVFTIVLFSTLLIFCLGQTAFSAKPIILKYTDPSKANTSRTKAAELTMREIEKRLDGRVKHEFYWAQSLMKSKDVLRGVQKGTADLGDATALIYHQKRFPLWQFSQLLFIVGPDQYAATRAYNEMYDTNPDLKKEADAQKLQLLTFNSLTPTVLISKKPFMKPEDFKGVRLRVLGPLAKWFGKMGGNAVSMRFYEINEALSRGVLDGAQAYVYSIHGYKFYEYCKALLMDGLSHITIDYWINHKSLAKLSSADQKVYLATWREFFVDKLVELTDAERKVHLADFKKAGVNMYNISSEQLANWKKVAEIVNEEQYFKPMEKKGIDGRKIVSQFQALYKKYERK